ncbi:MAG: alcohol dehydrogenase catalytic domain-containing protein [Holophagales bacterium]|nr:alcohol dehydrogenase catalytic domain-containing protein [Holophagales bacterium]
MPDARTRLRVPRTRRAPGAPGSRARPGRGRRPGGGDAHLRHRPEARPAWTPESPVSDGPRPRVLRADPACRRGGALLRGGAGDVGGQRACGDCRECRNGHPNLCGTAFDHRVWGTWAELVKVPARIVRYGLLRVPDGLAPAAAALLDPLASVLRGLGAGAVAGQTVLLLGAGPIALLFTSS